jgi:hypothetical protein
MRSCQSIIMSSYLVHYLMFSLSNILDDTMPKLQIELPVVGTPTARARKNSNLANDRTYSSRLHPPPSPLNRYRDLELTFLVRRIHLAHSLLKPSALQPRDVRSLGNLCLILLSNGPDFHIDMHHKRRLDYTCFLSKEGRFEIQCYN